MANSYGTSSSNSPLPSLTPARVIVCLFFIMILLLPFHTQVINNVIPLYTGFPAEILSKWKEFVLLLISSVAVLHFLLSHDRVRLVPVDFLIILFIGFMCIYVAVAERDRFSALYGFRVFAEPFAVFYIAKTIKVEMGDIRSFSKYLYIFGVLISLWAIFQAAVLGGRFLIDLGYKNEFGRLGTSFYISTFLFQRAVGTFSSPNIFGMYLQIVIMIGTLLYLDIWKSNKMRYFISVVLLMIALLYSFSRSAWLALSVAAFGMALMKRDPRAVIGRISKVLVVIALLCGSAFIFAREIMSTLFTHIVNTISLRDPAAYGHVVSLSDSFLFLLANPFGVGLGMSGPRSGLRMEGILNSENSFFIVGFDTGILGVVLYSLIMTLIFLSLVKTLRGSVDGDIKEFRRIVLLIYIGQLVAWNFLPYIVELEITMILFALVGLALNKNLRNEIHQRT